MSTFGGHRKKLPKTPTNTGPQCWMSHDDSILHELKGVVKSWDDWERGSLMTAAQILYPPMQCTDFFFLKADVCQLGVDQRKVNMLAREYCDAAGIKRKPVVLSHHMLYGLKAGQEKMSKSDPDSAVFMEDVAEDVERKIMNVYCPSKEEE
jgi:tyrosyl-tRNA synthetase